VALPDLTERLRRWHLRTSVQEEGFRVDEAELEYAAVDLATHQAWADVFNTADPEDAFDIVVEFEGSPVTLFRGIVTDWEFSQRWTQGGVESIGILRAQDLRGKLLRTLAPDDVQFPGVTFTPAGYTTPRNTFASVVTYLAGLVGLTVEVDPAVDYVLGSGATVAGYSLGAAIQHLLAPLQQARGVRADFVRTGIDRYAIRPRTIPLPAPDVILPMDVVMVRSYRRTRPKPPPAPQPRRYGYTIEQGQPKEQAQEEEPGPYSQCVDFAHEGVHGQTCREYQGGLLVQETTRRTYSTAEGGDKEVEDRTTFTYTWEVDEDFLLRRVVRIRNTTTVDGIVRREDEHTVHYDGEGRVIAETTAQFVTDEESGASVLERFDLLTKSEVGPIAVKTAMSDRITRDDVIPDPRQYELSPGTLSTDSERANKRPEEWTIATRPATSTPPVDPQIGKSLVEVELELPLDPRITAGIVVQLSDALITPSTFYVTATEAEWTRDQGHRMRVTAEAWV
jgi:hypothetical protein